jgi:5-methyltetrahydropteroyltriglutamate--homocysteine methyltransferase
MVQLVLANTGSYPRIGADPAAQRHRRAYAQRERDEISDDEWQAVEDDVTREVIAEQVRAGIELPTDGQIRWYDPISHLARALANVTVDGLLRYFDTNFYFRQPVVRGRLTRSGPVLLREFEVARAAAAPRTVKPVLTGPYSLAQGSILEGGYRDRRALAFGYAEVLAEEVADLARAGATLIQIDEPFVLRHPEDADVVQGALEILARARGSARLACYTYFGDAVPLYDELQALPVEVLGLDFTYGPKLAQRIAEAGSARVLGLGLIDGRNTKLETRETVYPILDQVLPRLGDTAHLNPSCGLELLPRDCARAKLETMVRLAREYAGPGGRPR